MESLLVSESLWAQLGMLPLGLLIGLLVVREALRAYDRYLFEARATRFNAVLVVLMVLSGAILVTRLGLVLARAG